MKDRFTYKEFLRRFSSEDKCLEEIKNIRFPKGIKCPKCKKIQKFYKLEGRKAYSCGVCRMQFHPLAGSIFEKSSTPLQFWLYAMYLLVQNKSGVSAKQLQRQLGVTYKTAWRMAQKVRELMDETKGPKLKGDVEVDEGFFGGSTKFRKHKFGVGSVGKETYMALVERKGRVIVKPLFGTGRQALIEPIKEHIKEGSRIITDQYSGYKNIDKEGFKHDSINRSKFIYRQGDVHIQNIENFWSHIKRGIYGTYRHVSVKHLPKYANEYAFRYNHRKRNGEMFNDLLERLA